MRSVLIFLTRSLLFISILCFGLFIWLKPQWKREISEEEMSEIISEIMNSRTAKTKFIELFHKTNPSAKLNYFPRIIRERKNSICSQLVYQYEKKLSIPEYISTALEIERNVNQSQCLQCLLKKYYFSNQVIGIQSAANTYFNKGLDKLNLDEQLTLIIMLKNPFLYHPIRRPELVQDQILKIKEMYDV